MLCMGPCLQPGTPRCPRAPSSARMGVAGQTEVWASVGKSVTGVPRDAFHRLQESGFPVGQGVLQAPWKVSHCPPPPKQVSLRITPLLPGLRVLSSIPGAPLELMGVAA